MGKAIVSEDSFWDWKSVEVMFKLTREYKEFTADDFYREARKLQMPPAFISKLVSAQFKRFKTAGYCVKTQNFRLSERNGSSPLPIYKAVEKAALSKNANEPKSQQNGTIQTTAVSQSQANEAPKAI